MIKFKPPEQRAPFWQLPAKLLRYFRGPDWDAELAELNAYDRALRIEIARTFAWQITDPERQAELLETIDQAEGQMRDKG